jgi:hypothetical protein
MTPEQELRRAGAARQLLGDPLFIEGREHVYARIQAARRSADLTATALHTRLVMLEQVADDFFGFFDQLAQTGKMAEEWLAQEERRKTLLQQGIDTFRRVGRSGL